MNAKALIEAITDFPTSDMLRYSCRVTLISSSGGGYLGSHSIDTYFLETDTVPQIKTKIRQSIIDHAATLGITVSTANIGSLMQI